MSKPIEYYLHGLESLATLTYTRNHIEKIYGEELKEDIDPLLHGDFSRITILEDKYKYLDWYHDYKQKEYRNMPLELRRIKEETSSFMVDKMSYFHQAYYYITCVSKLYNK